MRKGQRAITEQEPVPRIVLSCGLEMAEERAALHLRMGYVNAVVRAGGLPLPVVLAEPGALLVEAILEVADGVLLSGGEDVHPRYFGEDPRPGIGTVTPARDAFELALARGALRDGIPVLGICRGIQVLGAAAGGAIIQDLAGHPRRNPIEHRQTAPRKEIWHPVRCAAGSRLHATLHQQIDPDGALWVNSIHHQALRAVPRGWKAVAIAPDGILEGIEKPSHPFALGVQWHPEEMPEHLPLFSGLVRAAAEFTRTRRPTATA